MLFYQKSIKSDNHLLSKIDSYLKFSIEVLLKHPKFNDVKIDLNILNEIILCKTYLKLDPNTNNITLNIKVPRDILIIRGLPESIDLKELDIELNKMLLSKNSGDKDKGSGDEESKLYIKKENNSNWVVQFNSESEAKDAF